MSALIGLVLGVAIASAPWVSLDSTLRGLAEFYMAGVWRDFDAFGPSGEEEVQNAARSARLVPNVLQAEPVLPIDGLALNLSGTIYSMDAVAIEPTFASALGRIAATWTAYPSAGGAIVHDSLRSAGLATGDSVSLERRREVRDVNGSIVLTEVWMWSRRIDGFYNTTPGREVPTTFSFFRPSDLEAAKSDLNITHPLDAMVWGWLDRSALINPYDPDGSATRLTRHRTLLNGALEPHRFYTFGFSGLDFAVQQLAGHARLLRLWFLPFTIPTIGMSFLLSRIGFDIGLSGRRRELAVLRARGVSTRGIRGFLIVEITVISLFGALLGLGLALVLSRIFITLPMFHAFGGQFGGESVATAAEVVVSPVTIAFIVGFAWLLSWLGSRRALKIALAKDIVSAFRAYHSEEVSLPHHRSRDILLLAIGAAGMVLVASTLFPGVGPDLAAWLGLPTLVLGPLAPVLLTLGLVQYLTRGTTRPYRALARLLRVFLGPVEPLVVKNLARAPRRASNIAAIVTFAIAFLVAIGSITASSETYLNEQIYRETPSDVVVELLWSSREINRTSGQEIRAVPGVAEVTTTLAARSGLGTAFLFDATSYLRTVSWLEPRHLGGADPRQLMEALAAGDAAAVNSEFQRQTGLIPGDPVSVSLLYSHNLTVFRTFTGTLAAVVPSIPGMRAAREPQAYLDFSVLPPGLEGELSGRWKHLVDVSPGAEASEVARILDDRFQDRAVVWTLEDRLRNELANPVRAGTFTYLTIQSQMAALLMVLGIGLLVFFAASARRNELVTLVARGLRRGTVARLVMAEGWVVALLGILLGTAMGLLVTGSVLAITSTLLPIPMPIIVPASVVVPLLIVIAGVWVAGFVGALSIQRMDVARVLKLRGA